MEVAHLPAGLGRIFSSRELLDAFHDFTSSLYCEENLLFLEEVMDMKRQRRTSAIGSIFSKYIREDSPLQVNIDAQLQADIAGKFRNSKAFPVLELSVFDSAFTHVAELIERDSVVKFREVDGYVVVC